MNDIGFGLWLALVGMTVVFSLLLIVMGILVVLTRFDRPVRTGEVPSEKRNGGTGGVTPGSPAMTIEPRPGQGATGELTPEEIAAVSVAVIAHARVRRMQAAPVMRVHEPGSHLFASRWVAIGRSYQNQPWRRDK